MRSRHFRSIRYGVFLIVTFLFADNGFAVTVEPPKNPNSAKGCAICHYRWIDTFFVEGKGTDLVPYQSEKVVATPEMCFSCHDGSVMDSRDRMLHGKEHKTNVNPPAGMKIPEIFPLDEDGKVQCATCHTAHGVESGPDAEETIFLRTSNRDSAMCGMCHPDKGGGTAAGNHSLGKSGKVIPNSLKMRHAHEGSNKNSLICETCHTAHGSQSEGYLVKGAGDSGLCLDCHGEMNMFDPSGGRNANHAINVKPRTAPITAKLQKDGAKLGYNGVFTCQTCHKIHNNKPKEPALLFLNNRQAALCLECHPDKKRLEKTKHNLAVSAREEKNLEGETATESGMCSACHLPHKAARKPYKKNKNTDRTTALCLSCHARGMFAENEKLGGYLHPVDVTMSKTTGLELPLFNNLGTADKAGKLTCATCHDTHGGSIPPGPSPMKPDRQNNKNMLLRKSSPEICRPCHADKFAVEKTRHNLAGVSPGSNEILKQKVPEPDLCRNCHRIHSRDPEGFIWHKTTTAPGGNRVYDTCTTCHEKDGIAPEMTVRENSHPVNISLTSQTHRTTLPLFNATGKKTDKGLMTCRTCHDPHRSSPLKSDSGNPVSVKGSPANPFLRIDAAPDSDLCINCHGDKADVRLTDHNLVATAPDAKNTPGRSPFESGVCGACHLTHNSVEKIALWARVPGPGDDVMERLCNSCHSRNGAAANKVPQVSSHPETLFVSQWEGYTGDASAFPLFDKKTARHIKAGNISCPSCHDVHHWGPRPLTDKMPVNREGDATTSFLRPNIPEQVCRHCHGPEGLFAFKYFHEPEERKK